MPRPLRIAITPGDPDGIGPEIVSKALKKRYPGDPKFIIIGASNPFKKNWPLPKRSNAEFIPAPAQSKYFLPGFQSGWSIKTAAQLAISNHVDAIVTGPIHKERLNLGGFHFPGHTEFLQNMSKVKSTTMCLENSQLRITLVTTHCSLKSVSKGLSRKRIEATLINTIHYLKNWVGVTNPKIAVCALNPHSGENGLFGNEELDLIQPTIKKFSSHITKNTQITGPWPADTLFAKHFVAPKSKKFDAIVCMYHDQGLIPVKLLDFPRTINITLGLPFLRTSVDHGTGFDIAGKGIADPSSLESAILTAIRLVSRKRQV